MDEKRPLPGDVPHDARTADTLNSPWFALSPMSATHPSSSSYGYPDEKAAARHPPPPRASSSRRSMQAFHPLGPSCSHPPPHSSIALPYGPASPSCSSPPPASSPPPHLPYAYPQPHSQSRSMRRVVLLQWMKPWIPFILYAITSLGFVFAITMYKDEVFKGLDDLAIWLRKEEFTGYAILFTLIFITTIPPMPLYSTLTILSGYTFGAWPGAVISYFAALTGAVTVFWVFRNYCRGWVGRCLSHNVTLRRVVRAIERRPQLLFLIRLAPYPYNVMNALLAGSPTLTFRTYASCTALSLFKVIIHTSVGSSIRSFAEYHTGSEEGAANGDESGLGQTSTIAGIALCVGITIYLSYIARKAIDEELGTDELGEGSEETMVLPQHRDEMAEQRVGSATPPPLIAHASASPLL